LGVLYYLVALAPLPFVASWWSSVEWGDDWHRRQRIADGLLLRGALVGKSRTEIVDLLGEPPPTPYFADWSLVYNLGSERSFIGIDSEWLVLRIGSTGVVTEAAIVRD
jgi:hypothetical protein